MVVVVVVGRPEEETIPSKTTHATIFAPGMKTRRTAITIVIWGFFRRITPRLRCCRSKRWMSFATVVVGRFPRRHLRFLLLFLPWLSRREPHPGIDHHHHHCLLLSHGRQRRWRRIPQRSPASSARLLLHSLRVRLERFDFWTVVDGRVLNSPVFPMRCL